MTDPKSQLTPYQREVIAKIEALQHMTALTGFRTTRSQNQLLAKLEGDDLAAVAAVIYHK